MDVLARVQRVPLAERLKFKLTFMAVTVQSLAKNDAGAGAVLLVVNCAVRQPLLPRQIQRIFHHT